ncbi:MAG: phospho-N-acetylmuramoyl-pentapeptide-transferase [Candidatus Omnitrophica bacterium]|nr:phospho-N-acetylmuramoyl-pentapeptide-transferase [Candidatus Omnitrophota bacterium]
MLFSLLYPLKEHFFAFNVLKYITFRAALAYVFAFLFCVLLGPLVISALRDLKVHHSHGRAGFASISEMTADKAVVPTMGGAFVVLAVGLSCLLWGDLSNRYFCIALLGVVWLALFGFADDALKLMRQNARGLKGRVKLMGQLALGVALGVYLYRDDPGWATISVPFFKDWVCAVGPWYVVLVCLVITGTSNAVNLTDGLDGLAVGCTVMVTMTYALFSYLTGHAVFAEYLYLPYLPGSGELMVFCAALAGASTGFLWFNAHPASVFLGDTGSLRIGGAIAIVAILIKKELLLFIVGGVFVMEALSVILQVGSFKMTGRRMFKMAPVHHHFQLEGWKESKVVIRFWILGAIFSLMGLATLKLR